MAVIRIDASSALIIVDVQRDFLPGGALPVPEGDEVIPILNRYIEIFKKMGGKIFATRDWHPVNHISFRSRGGAWPPHCVQGTKGAEFSETLRLPEDLIVVSKATDPDSESYSGFAGTDLADKLRKHGVKRVFIGGLATEYCVKNTVLDAAEEGFETYFLEDASKGINLNPGDVERAIEEMLEKGALKIRISDIKEDFPDRSGY
ncbi:MAG: nicotinamidase [Candidatus Bathyarchaeia archaeon]